MVKYWSLNFHHKTTLEEQECEEKLLGLLREATKIRMISDVPLGAFLSSSGSQLSFSESTITIFFLSSIFNQLKTSFLDIYCVCAHHYITHTNKKEILFDLCFYSITL